VKRVEEITEGKKVPVVYDSVGKDTFLKSLDCLAPLGVVALFGQSSGSVEPLNLGLLAQKGSLYITRPTLVTYTSKRLKPDIEAIEAGGAAAQDHMRKMLTTKFSHWRYENELRIFVKLNTKDRMTGLYFVHFSKKVALREIIIGQNSTISQAELRRALGSKADGVEIYKAQLAFQTFRVVRQKLDRLWE